MGRRHADAMFIRRRGLTLVIPRTGARYYVRSLDGAIGRREGDTMFWVVRVDGAETIATEVVGDDVLAVDTAVEEMAEEIESFRDRE
jgi:hypothetical protein